MERTTRRCGRSRPPLIFFPSTLTGQLPTDYLKGPALPPSTPATPAADGTLNADGCMNTLERKVRAAVIGGLRDSGRPPGRPAIATPLGVSEAAAIAALHALAAEHRLVLLPDTDDVWMAHPFSAVPTDFVVRIDGREWFANCVWDGLAILALLGDGTLSTHSPASGEPFVLQASGGRVVGDPIVHFLVPARHFWDDIGFT